MILLVDNYDSFSYNLYQLVGKVQPDIRVIRNDELAVPEIEALHPDGIILSPGPGRPETAGRCLEIIGELGPEIPILGVCLGHQAICAAYGARITYAGKLMHGKASEIEFDAACPLFHGCPPGMSVARYHSLAVEPLTMPECLQVVARTREGEIMAVAHAAYPVYGVQFHPESILTPQGDLLLRNFLGLAGRKKK